MTTPPPSLPADAMLDKWSWSGVPHRGWTCVGIDDLGEPSDTCEMCGTATIRFVHHMQHPDYPEVLGCGCICAGHMEQDRQAAEARERRVVNRASRRKNFLARQTWKLSARGNPHIKIDGYHVTIFPRGHGYTLIVSRGDEKAFGQFIYPTQDRAALAAFDAVMFLGERAQHEPDYPDE